MEPTNQPNTSGRTNEQEVDLGQLFYKTGGVINNFFSWLARLFSEAATGILQILFFLRRNFLWLVLGTAVGTGYGFYLLSRNGIMYSSDMTVRTNFNSSRALYGTIDYFNALISNGQTGELARVFNITPAEASSLVSFEANPVKSELLMADMYKEQFLNAARFRNSKSDTLWATLIKYADFKSELTKYDLPLHEVSLTSTSASIFSKIQPGLVSEVSANRLLQSIRDSNTETNKEVAAMLITSLRNLDTLSSAYSKRLASGSAHDLPANNITLMEGPQPFRSPELDVFDKQLELKEELKAVKKQEVVENSILPVYSSFSALGHKESFFRQNIARYAMTGLLSSLAILTLIAFNKYIRKKEESLLLKKKIITER